MPQNIKTLCYGSVNAFLIKSGDDFLLVDTGLPAKRSEIEKELETAGCLPGTLKLIVLTHGDYDHAGNAAYFGKKYGAKIAMHPDDVERVERGDWNWGLKDKPDKFPIVYRIVSFFIRPGVFDTFKPDIFLVDGQSLSSYGCDAQVLHLPGHTKGSIGVMTNSGDLFCGDLMDNMSKPRLEFFIDDLPAANASIAKLKNNQIVTIYPGHGKSFSWVQFLKKYRA
jgi:hydroxyacylglutathione hydrolase